ASPWPAPPAAASRGTGTSSSARRRRSATCTSTWRPGRERTSGSSGTVPVRSESSVKFQSPMRLILFLFLLSSAFLPTLPAQEDKAKPPAQDKDKKPPEKPKEPTPQEKE